MTNSTNKNINWLNFYIFCLQLTNTIMIIVFCYVHVSKPNIMEIVSNFPVLPTWVLYVIYKLLSINTTHYSNEVDYFKGVVPKWRLNVCHLLLSPHAALSKWISATDEWKITETSTIYLRIAKRFGKVPFMREVVKYVVLPRWQYLTP